MSNVIENLTMLRDRNLFVKMEQKKASSFHLSSSGLANAKRHNVKNDFKFLVGKNPPYKEYPCNSFFANFISPKVAMLHASDPNVSSFVLPIDDGNQNFQLVMDLMYGHPIKPTDIQVYSLREFAKILGNDELHKKFNDNSGINTTNVVSRLEEKYSNGMDASTEIEYIAKNIASIPPNSFAKTPIILLERILSHPDILVKDEDSLFEFIEEIVLSRNPRPITLFSHIIFENLRTETLNHALSLINPETLTSQLWESLRTRIGGKVTIELEKGKRYYRDITDCRFADEEFDGILHMLFKKCKTNPVDNNIIDVSSSSDDTSSSEKPKNLFDFNQSRNQWSMNVKKGNYLLIDFKASKVKIDGYSIKSGSGSHWENEQSWVIEGSNDNINYKIIDEKIKNKEMGGSERVHHWSCHSDEAYRYIRWRLTKDGNGSKMTSRQFELFGQYIVYLGQTDEHANEIYDEDEYPQNFPFSISYPNTNTNNN